MNAIEPQIAATPSTTRRNAVESAESAMSSAADPRPRRPPAPRLDSRSLFNGALELGIEHKGELYRLRITRSGKLILTK